MGISILGYRLKNRFLMGIKMKLKFYLIIICIFVFGCKNKNRVSYDGVLMLQKDLPFRWYYVSHDIFLKTSIKDEVFPDGVRYYAVIPKDNNYQNFINNIGKTVKIEGEEYTAIVSIPDISIRIPEEGEEKETEPYLITDYRYDLGEAKIVKVY